MDPRLSNTASMADYWLPTWPGSEAAVLLTMARIILVERLYNCEYMRRWVNWQEYMEAEQPGEVQTFDWDQNLETVLPRPLAVKKIRFRVRRGARYYYRHLAIRGLKSLSPSQARAFFVQIGFLVPLKSTRIYTPSRLDRSISDLSGALARKGFENASSRRSSIAARQNKRAGPAQKTSRRNRPSAPATRSARKW